MEKTYKILVIDDEAEAVYVINQILLKSKKKYELLNAFNAESTLKIVKNEKPDLIICDWDMPGMTGIDLIQELKKNTETASIPVIICTGKMNRPEDLIYAYEAGAIDYLRKPVEEMELVGRINAMLKFAEINKQLQVEREKHILDEKKLLEENLELLNNELNKRGLLIYKYSELFKNIYETLKKIPYCPDNKVCKPSIDNIFNSIINLNHNEKIEELYTSFDELYPDYFTKMLQKYPDLSKTELKLAALLKLNLTTKEISSITGQTVRAVEMTRFRLRSKMNLNTEDNILNFL